MSKRNKLGLPKAFRHWAVHWLGVKKVRQPNVELRRLVCKQLQELGVSEPDYDDVIVRLIKKWAWDPSKYDADAVLTQEQRNKVFYETDEWRDIRYRALKLHGARCQCCGRKPPAVVIHVDHIKPRSKFPELELEISNLQVLCEDCNLGKRAWDQTDWRSHV